LASITGSGGGNVDDVDDVDADDVDGDGVDAGDVSLVSAGEAGPLVAGGGCDHLGPMGFL
jgi:hypothetical protein